MNVGVKNPLHATGFLSRVGSSLFAAPATGEPPRVKDVNGLRLDIPANEFLAAAKKTYLACELERNQEEIHMWSCQMQDGRSKFFDRVHRNNRFGPSYASDHDNLHALV